MSKGVKVYELPLSKLSSSNLAIANSNLMYLRSVSMHMSSSSQRKKRRGKSRILKQSRQFSLLSSDEGRSSLDFHTSEDTLKVKKSATKLWEPSTLMLVDEHSSSKVSKGSVLVHEWKDQEDSLPTSVTECNTLEVILPSSDIGSIYHSIGLSPYTPISDHPYKFSGASAYSFDGGNPHKNSSASPVSFWSLKPCKENSLGLAESDRRWNNSIESNYSDELRRQTYEVNVESINTIPETQQSEKPLWNDVEFKQENRKHNTEIVCTDEDDDTLPPYYQIIPEMFYKFAGISDYSDSNRLQSKEDFEKLLVCLGLESMLKDFLFWFPIPELVKPGSGYITLDQFCDLFTCKFAQTVLQARWQYETLCTAILTMKCLDCKKRNKITFSQLSDFYRSLYSSGLKVETVRTVWNKYDLNGSGFLTIADIFNFCSDEEVSTESGEEIEAD